MKVITKKNPIANRAALIWRQLRSLLSERWVSRTPMDQTVDRGRKQAAAGDQAAALDSFLAFYNNRANIGHLIRRRNANVVFDLLKLADVYPPATVAITAIADQIEAEIRGLTAGDEDVSDWCTIIRHLGQFDRAWNLYNSLIQQDAATGPKLAGVVYARLIAERRYPEALGTAIENARWTMEEVEPKPKSTDEKTQLFTYWLPSVYEAFEVLLACGAKEWSDQLEQWALSVTAHPSIYDGLIKAAQRAEQPDLVQRLTAAKSEKFKS